MLALATATAAADSVPGWMNFQGKLTADGKLANGLFSMEFSLYSSAGSGNPLYQETQEVPVVDGLYEVQLGTADPADFLAACTKDTLFIEVQVQGADVEPRLPVTPVGYAFRTQGVPDRSIGHGHIEDGAVHAEHIAEGVVVKSLQGEAGDLLVKPGAFVSVASPGPNITLTAEASFLPGTPQSVFSFPVAEGRSVAIGDVMTLVDGALRKGAWTDRQVGPYSGDYLDRWTLVALSSNRLVCAAINDANEGRVVLGERDGTNVTWGTPLLFAVNCLLVDLAPLTDERFVLAFLLHTSPYKTGRTAIGRVTGPTSLGLSGPSDFSSTMSYAFDVAAVDSNRYVVAYQEYTGPVSTEGVGRPAEVLDGGGEFLYSSWGSPEVFHTNSVPVVFVEQLEGRELAMVYEDPLGSDLLTFVQGYVSPSGVLSWSDPTPHPRVSPHYLLGLTVLPGRRIVAACRDSANEQNATLVPGVVEQYGGDIEWGDGRVLSPVAGIADVRGLGDDRFVVLYREGGGHFLRSVIGWSDGIDVEFGFDQGVYGDYFDLPQVASLGDGHLAAIYQEGGAPHDTPWLALAVTGDRVGLALEDRSGGQLCKVLLAGQTDALGDLEPHATYYDDGFGNLSTNRASRAPRIGVNTPTDHFVVDLEN